MHCHILPGLDDGASTPAETLAMLRTAVDEGITDIVVTPHFKLNTDNASPRRIYDVMRSAQEAVDHYNIPIRFYPGNEVFYFDDLPRYLKEKRIFTMNGSDFVLIEFSPITPYHTIQNALDSVLFAGYHPIIAHVERYESILKNPEHVEFLFDMGVRIQVNASSVTGDNGKTVKKFVHELLKDGLVDFIGTDAHSNRHRKPEIIKCKEILIKKCGVEYARQLLRDNAVELLGLD